MIYNSLKIKNFRGIKSLELNDLKRINILVGKNNCGKTSIIEAILLLSSYSNPSISFFINNTRGILLTSDEDFKYNFKDFDFSSKIIFEGSTINNNINKLEIIPTREISIPVIQNVIKEKEQIIHKDISIGQQNFMNSVVSGIQLIYKIGEQDFNFQLSLTRPTISFPVKEGIKIGYIHPKEGIHEIIQIIGDLKIKKELEGIVSVMKKIEPRIESIEIGAGNLIYADIGLKELSPVNIMGDGLIRTMSVLAHIGRVKGGVLLIDEIENGLHYSSMKNLWHGIIETTKKYDVQVIATTHSYECIEYLADIYSEIEPDMDDIRMYRIEKIDNIHKAFSSSIEVLRAGIERNFELR